MDNTENTKLILNILNSLQQQFNSLQQQLNTIQDKLDSIENRLDIVEHRLDAIENRLDVIEHRLDILEEKVDSLDERLSLLENVVTKIEYEHGNKIDLLLDYAVQNTEQHSSFEETIFNIQHTIFIHDARISVLEDLNSVSVNSK